MNCLTEETAMMYADGELSADQERLVASHAPECLACRDAIATLQQENSALVSYYQKPIPNRRRAIG